MILHQIEKDKRVVQDDTKAPGLSVFPSARALPSVSLPPPPTGAGGMSETPHAPLTGAEG